jgi:hypothetical protein
MSLEAFERLTQLTRVAPRLLLRARELFGEVALLSNLSERNSLVVLKELFRAP